MRQLFYLQNATKVYYKMLQLLQNASILLQNATVLQNATFNTKCDGIDMYTKGK